MVLWTYKSPSGQALIGMGWAQTSRKLHNQPQSTMHPPLSHSNDTIHNMADGDSLSESSCYPPANGPAHHLAPHLQKPGYANAHDILLIKLMDHMVLEH